MGNCCPQTSDKQVVATSTIANVDKLTTTVYGPRKPPVDWQDCVFLVPHEAIRRETDAFVKSVQALNASSEAWKLTLLSRWYVEYFFGCIMQHHDNEEELYFPFLKEKGAKFPEENGMIMSHKDLVKTLKEIKESFEKILEKEGKYCSDEVAYLKRTIPAFGKDLKEHIDDEERNIPKIIRDIGVSEAESDAVVGQIIAKDGLEGLKFFLPSIVSAGQDWMTQEFYDNFMSTMPPPIVELIHSTFLPNYRNVISAMRDAPTLAAEPDLSKEIPLDMSKLPPPPPEAAK